MAHTPYPGETNGLQNPQQYHKEVTHTIEETVDWTDKRLVKITRLRLLSDPGYPHWDVSYCHGVLFTGQFVNVDLPFDRLPKKGARAMIVRWAKQDKVFAKGIGIFDAISTLI